MGFAKTKRRFREVPIGVHVWRISWLPVRFVKASTSPGQTSTEYEAL